MQALLLIAGLVAPLAVHAQNDAMISVSVPPGDKVMQDGTVEVTIHLYGAAKPKTLNVEMNEQNVTDYFAGRSCYSAPCDVTVKLNGNFVNQGWNYLRATVDGPNDSTDLSSAQFYNDRGVNPTDATTGYAPSFAVHIHATETSGLEVDYAPGVGNVPIYYPFARFSGCPYALLTLVTLDRSTLAPKSSNCFGPNSNTALNTYLKSLTKADLVFASGNKEAPLGKLNLAPIGGTDFSAAGAPNAFGFSIIGYGASTPGLAAESYNLTPDGAWRGVEGNLINVGVTTPMFGFRSTDAPAFAIQPSASGGQAKITIGYNTSFPIGQGELPPNFTLPGQFTNRTYTSPACTVACDGGLFTALFDAKTLQLRWSNTYATNSSISSAEVNRMANDLNFHLYSYPQGPSVVIITSIGNPFGTADHWSAARYVPSPALFDIIQSLGVSGTTFSKLITGGSFSMIGVPNGQPKPNQGLHSLTKWYSTTQQAGETGALRGFLLRDKTFLFSPQNVGPFMVASSNTNPTANDLLAFAIPSQIGLASSVNWPAMDTVGRRNAYAYASDQMNRSDYYTGSDCRLPKVQCEDIRARYTSSQLEKITGGIDPRTIAYPSGTEPNFTRSDLTAVANQLYEEKEYLSSTENYALFLREINNNGLLNVGLAVQSSAANVARTLYAVDRNANSALSLVPGILGSSGAIVSTTSTFIPPASVIAGVLGSASSLIDLYKSVKNVPDAEVSKLADLIAEGNNRAFEYATNFNTAVQSSTGMYFNGVYSDWFKLQTIGMMTVTPGSGWYYDTAGNAMTEYNKELIASARTSFYQQTVPQYFAEIRLHKIAYSHYGGDSSPKIVDDWAAEQNGGFPLKYMSRAYVWDSWPTPGYPRCRDYVYVVTKSSGVKVPAYLGSGVNTWDDALGNALMAPADSTSPSAGLGIARGFVYDTSGYSVLFDTNSRFPVKGECGIN